MIMTKNIKPLLIGAFCFFLTDVAKADLLGVNPAYPVINFVNTDPSAVSYDPASQVFSVDAAPYNIYFSGSDSGTLIVSNRSVQIQLDTDGTLLSGSSGFNLSGQFTRVVSGVSNSYSGTLLQGDVTAFGYLYSGAVNEFDFRVNLTGGELQSLFNCASDLAITMTSEASTFTNSFTTAFNGTAKGYCGPDDTTPPTITCPSPSAVTTTPATDPSNPSITGFIVTYPDPTVTDICDPSPSVYSDTPSGSFVALSAGDSLTITNYATDVSGNYSFCSFTVVMGQPGSCPLGFTDSSCAPVTLSADPGLCSATYSFPLPEATNCNGQTFVAAATALSENGSAIALTTLSDGMLQGEFPRTLTTNGDIITFTASDGNGNQVVRQCQVFVEDTQPPVIACMNQTATFKPILTNALSCIEADFNNNCIPAGGRRLSVVQQRYPKRLVLEQQQCLYSPHLQSNHRACG
jgi:hypothetical protein